MGYIELSDDVLAGIVAASNAREAAQDAREMDMRARYPDDIRQLYAVWRAGTGSSAIAGQILTAAHSKGGMIDAAELRTLDLEHLDAALRVMGMFGFPGLLSDQGLTVAPDGSPLLTTVEVQELLRETHESEPEML